MYSEAQKKATMKYNNANYKIVGLQLRYDSDKDILEWLEKNKPFSPTIKKAIREYMKKGLE